MYVSRLRKLLVTVRQTAIDFSTKPTGDSQGWRQAKGWLAAGRLLVLLQIIWFTVCLPAFSAEGWKAGVAKVKITPGQPMPMAGYAGRGMDLPHGTINDLWAKVLMLEDSRGKRGLLVTMDVCGIDRELSKSICQQLAEKLGMRQDAVVLSTSHTHSGPVVSRYLEPMHYRMFDETNQRLVDEYSAKLVENIVQCASEALANLKPSRLSHGEGYVTFATNRRNNPADSVPKRRAAGTLVGPADYSVPVLAVHQDDILVASVFGYACHCTSLSGMEWSSDYAGFAQDFIEAERPKCIAMFWAGCGADQNPLPRRTVELAEKYGRQLADGVTTVLDGLLRSIEPKLVTQRTEIPLSFSQLPTEETLANDTQSDNKFIASRAKMLLARVRSGQSLSPTYPYPIATWKLGDSVHFVALGGEVVVDFSLAIKSTAQQGVATWVMGYANDVMAYIPSRRVLTEGGYEGGGAMIYYGLPSAWAPDIERSILTEVERQLTANIADQVRLFPDAATPELLQETGAGEGPLWVPKLGLLTSGDGHVMLHSVSGEQSIYIEKAGTNGLALDAQGRLLMCQSVSRQITRREADGSLTVLTDNYQGLPYNQPNDITLDSRGRIYFSDPQYGPRDNMAMVDAQGRKVEGVYRIDADGTVTRIIAHEVDRPNGLVISADDRYLFVADNNNNTVGGARKLWRFELSSTGDVVSSSRTLLYDWRETRGPDGMEMDELGRIYVAAGSNRQNPPFETQPVPTAGVYVFTSDGQLLDFLPILRDECTNVAFGGQDGMTLFTTAGGTLWSVPTLTPGAKALCKNE